MNNALWAAATCAALSGIIFSNRTAWPLLGSLALCMGLRRLEIPFDTELWIEIDVLAALFIYRRNMPRRDWIILGLFIPAWIGYALPDPWRHRDSLTVVILQLLLTVPLIKYQGAHGAVSHGKLHEVQNGKRA